MQDPGVEHQEESTQPVHWQKHWSSTRKGLLQTWCWRSRGLSWIHQCFHVQYSLIRGRGQRYELNCWFCKKLLILLKKTIVPYHLVIDVMMLILMYTLNQSCIHTLLQSTTCNGSWHGGSQVGECKSRNQFECDIYKLRRAEQEASPVFYPAHTTPYTNPTWNTKQWYHSE